MRPVPAGRQRGQCCTPYSRLQEEIDNVETIAVTANNTANNAANAANTAVNTANSAASDAADALAGLTDGSVTQIGTSNVGTDTKPIKLVGGVPTIVANDLVDTATAQTVGGTKTYTGQQIATGQRAYNPANTDDIATIGTLDAYTPMVRTTGTQRKSGSLIMTSPDSFYLNTSINYNHAMIKSTGQSMSLDFRRRNSDDSASDPSMSFGRWYSDGTSLYCGMTAYAPRTTIGDTSEVQRWGRITIKVQKNGGVSIYVSANKSDGTVVDKIITTFDGTSWS